MVTWLGTYEAETTGVRIADNVSVRLEGANHPQPDIALILDPDLGGRTRITDDDYIQDPPELIAEALSAIGLQTR